ncbi:TauD/TfdA family dioxygenase [Streptomyces sp. NPDC005395]|uniref:TauD/TfdA family dioxygenase n=1 Tax=Streptomyces sp. NPDC005395 TaxID=3157042 RepID=UPI0033A9B698
MSDAFRVPLPPALTLHLATAAADLPDAQLDEGLLSADSIARYGQVLDTSPEAADLLAHLRQLLDNPDGDGCAVIETAPLLDALPIDEAGRAITAMLSWVALPLRAFDRWPLWKPLGTNLRIDPMRATGAGYNPMHMDIVNATLPPDYSVLLCVRPDPRGEGHSLVSQVRRAVERLDAKERALLSDEVYRDGAFFELTGVGEEWNPFPILDGKPAHEGFVRFTAKMLPDLDQDDPHTLAARALDRELVTGQKRFRLERGDMVIVNQHLCMHGRTPLGAGQEDVLEGKRRLLWQMFLRGAGGAQ